MRDLLVAVVVTVLCAGVACDDDNNPVNGQGVSGVVVLSGALTNSRDNQDVTVRIRIEYDAFQSLRADANGSKTVLTGPITVSQTGSNPDIAVAVAMLQARSANLRFRHVDDGNEAAGTVGASSETQAVNFSWFAEYRGRLASDSAPLNDIVDAPGRISLSIHHQDETVTFYGTDVQITIRGSRELADRLLN